MNDKDKKTAAEIISDVVPLNVIISFREIQELIVNAGYKIRRQTAATALRSMMKSPDVDMVRTGDAMMFYYRFFEFHPEFYSKMVKTFRVSFEGHELTKAEHALVKMVRNNNGTICHECVNELGISNKNINQYLVKLMKLGLIARIAIPGKQFGGMSYVYFGSKDEIDQRRAEEIVASSIDNPDLEYASALLVQRFNQLQQSVRHQYGQSI